MLVILVLELSVLLILVPKGHLKERSQIQQLHAKSLKLEIEAVA